MIKLFSRPLVVAALVALTRGQDPAPAAASGAGAATTPRLVVLCSVDQLASWVFEEAQPHFTTEGGFQRLVRDGVTFTNCAYEHACTETGPGHATIGTGAPARLHGIVRNSWYSAEVGKTVYCVGVAAEALPELPEGRNRGPGRLLAPTLSQTMRQQLAGCRTASVSWKDRSAILMVGAEADVAAWIETSTGHLVTNRTWCREVPPWIARFNADRVLEGL